MQRKPARASKTNKGSTAVTVECKPAIGPRDSAALGLALDENPPPAAVQEDILRRVLKTINTEITRPSKGRAPTR